MVSKNIFVVSSPICCCICISTLLFVILLALSIKNVEQDQLAIQYNTVSKEIENDIATEGRQTTDPAVKFFIYPRNVQTLRLDPVLCYSSDALFVEMVVIIQFQIEQDKLIDTFRIRGQYDGYLEYLESISREISKDVCSQYTGQNFFNRRQEISQDITTSLNNNYVSQNVGSLLISSQLASVVLPPEFQNTNELLQQEIQRGTELLSIRTEAIINAQANLNAATATAQVRLTIAQGDADAILRVNEQELLQIAARWNNREQAFLDIINMAGADPNNLPDLLRYDAITGSIQPIINI